MEGGHEWACRWCLPARPDSVRLARDLLHNWLDRHQWPEDAAEDLVLAVSEAVTNAVEHASPAGAPREWVEINADLVPAPHAPDGGPCRQARVVIRDEGQWRPFLADTDDLARPRGRGPALIRSITARLTTDTGGHDRGTWMTLLSHPVPGPGGRPSSAVPQRPDRA